MKDAPSFLRTFLLLTALLIVAGIADWSDDYFDFTNAARLNAFRYANGRVDQPSGGVSDAAMMMLLTRGLTTLSVRRPSKSLVDAVGSTSLIDAVGSTSQDDSADDDDKKQDKRLKADFSRGLSGGLGASTVQPSR